MTLVEAMAKFEGYGANPKNRPTRNNNPCNIKWGAFARKFGATRVEEIPVGYKSTPKYAYFPNPELGFAAAKTLLQIHYKGMTVHQALHKWAPPIENDTNLYIRYICQKLKCTPDTVIDELLEEEQKDDTN